jgi:hypothetical protein
VRLKAEVFKMRPRLLVLLSVVAHSLFGQNYTIPTFAGGGLPVNVPGTSAHLLGLGAVALDGAGNLFLPDGGLAVLRMDSKTAVLTLVAGNGTPEFSGDNGLAINAELSAAGLAVDAAGNLYIADTLNGRIRKVSHGVITTVAGGGSASTDDVPATSAYLPQPVGLAVDSAGNLYIADETSNTIRKVSNGVITTVAGSWISIFGTDLANTTALWNGNFPQSLGGTTVTIDNQPAYLWYVTPQQINLQAPNDATTGVVEVAVNTASGTAYSTVTLAAYAPSFSLLGVRSAC